MCFPTIAIHPAANTILTVDLLSKLRSKKCLLTLLLVCSGVWSGVWSARATPWFSRVWQVDDGLPGDNVTGVAQTKDGYLWIATQTGLARFDGIHFLNYKIPRGRSHPIIRAMLLDDQDRLWLAEEGGAVVCMLGEDRLINPKTNGLSKAQPLEMTQDAAGGVWVANADGTVCRILGGKVTRFGDKDGLPAGGTCCLIRDAQKQVWFAKAGQVGVFREGRFETILSFNERTIHLQARSGGGVWICAGDRLLSCDATGVSVEIATIHLYASGGARTIANHVYLNGVTNTVLAGTNALTFTGDVDLGGVTKTLTVSNTALTTFSGVMTNSAAIIKAGPGRLVFSGDNSSRTNTTTVNDGTLLVNNTTGSGTGSGAVIVNSPGTLGGSGTIAGLVTVAGNIAPGQSAGALTLGGGLDLNSGGTYVWELAANATNGPGTNFDILPLTNGNLFLGGSAKLSIHFTGSATAPDAGNPFWQSVRQWTVIPLSGGATNIGPTVFPTLLNGTNAAGYFTNFAAANGDIVLQFIPDAVAPTPPPQPVISPVIVGANTASAVISWSATNSYTYTVQLKTNLTQPTWITLGTSTATGTNATFTDTTGPRPQSYYRVIWP